MEEPLGAVQTRELAAEERRQIEKAIGRLHNLPNYTFTALELSASVNVDVIAEVFVRINGKGKKLNQADFIMTLMSVFWDEGRTELEAFATKAAQPSDGGASPFNHVRGGNATTELVGASVNEYVRARFG